MNKKQLLIAAFIAALAFAAGGWLALQQQTSRVDNGAGNRVAFSLPDMTGKSRAIDEWNGKVMLLNFWATWCPPCREEIPAFVEVQEQFGGQGFQIIGVAIDKKEDISDFMDTFFINYPVLVGDDTTLKLMADYGNRIGSLPYSVIMDREGRIIARKIGAYRKSELVELIKPLL
ncbi:MAG: TlpA family protein disulfide reductase [Gammaproteobacteria bacterium]|nr:TlpA family protein disulfide reductase [Gammaproteobacteria bacterium]